MTSTLQPHSQCTKCEQWRFKMANEMVNKRESDCDRYGKVSILHSSMFLTNSTFPGAFEFSSNHHVSLINNNSIYIFMFKSLLPDLASPIRFSISVLPNPKEEKPFDVGINPDIFCVQANKFKEAHSFVLDNTLNPNRTNFMAPAFSSTKWSPSHCSYDGRLLLGSLSINNHVYINGAEEHTGKWKPLLDLTKILHDDLKTNLYKDVEIVDEDKENDIETQSKLSKRFEVYRRRNYYFALTAFCWCPVVVETENEEIPQKKMHLSLCSSDQRQNGALLLLATSNKLGWLFIWGISVTDVSDKINAKVLSTVKFDCHVPTTAVWYQEQSSTKGYIAVGFSNGHIKICTIEVKIDKGICNPEAVSIYELWAESDMMIPKFIQWMEKDGKLLLVVTKMTNILIFTLKMDDLSLVKSHSYECAPSLHHLPITSLSCKGNLIATSGSDGIIQYYRIGEKASHLISKKCPDGFSCMGMQLSHNGLMMMKMLCPNVMLYVQGRYAKEMELTMYPVASLEDSAQQFLSPRQPMTLEFCEFIRVMTVQQKIPDVLTNFSETEITSHRPVLELQKLNFLSWLIDLKKGAKSANFQTICSQKLYQRGVAGLIKEKVYIKTLREALGILQNGARLDKNDEEFVLLCADWLVCKGRISDSYEIATSIYRALDDTVSMERSNLLNVEQNESNSGISNVKSDGNELDTLKMPCREACPICTANVNFESEEYGKCGRNHRWKRCFLTLRIMTGIKNRTCICCGALVSCKLQYDENQISKLTQKMLDINNCVICNGDLVILS